MLVSMIKCLGIGCYILCYSVANGVVFASEETVLGGPRTTISQDVQNRFPAQLAFAKFLSRIKGNFGGSVLSMILALY